MHQYYQQFAPAWDVAKVFEVTKNLKNYDLLFQGEVAGIMRLQFEADCCYLRDLQVTPTLQNKGIGNAAIHEAKRQALDAKMNTVQLRVF
ncbi:GNAT family N-acetyltransferase [Alteromonas aestuariivivens]|uniref:GNAT family N-acetyltransferase n=1 Tax=Alteromonas aestuariivivens TaxID=1938339 RepID=UPI00319E6B25